MIVRLNSGDAAHLDWRLLLLGRKLFSIEIQVHPAIRAWQVKVLMSIVKTNNHDGFDGSCLLVACC